jgi:hypothetical protein
MMTALVLICSLAQAPLAMECGTDNAVDVLRVPGEYGSLVTCFTRAQAFVGESRYELTADHYLKVACGKPRLPANIGFDGRMLWGPPVAVLSGPHNVTGISS